MQPNTNSKNFIIIGLVVLFLIIIVGFLSTRSASESAPVTQIEKEEPRDAVATKNIPADTTNNEPEVVNVPSEIDTQTPKVITTKGVYSDYDATAIANSDADNIVLFFKASWCPTCNALNADIEASLDNIPAGTEIYTVDFDISQQLRKKYGVTVQHTLVSINSDGTMFKKFIGSPTLKSVLASL
jgi:thiol-disulfide isomerase/thioredoxin